MTIGLQITNGTTTVDLNDGAYFEIMELDLGFGDVSALTVQGSIRLYVNGTKTQVQTEYASLSKLLQQAVEYSGTGQGAALYSSLDEVVYLNYRTDSTEAYYRSPIVRANLQIESGSFEVLNFDCGGIEVLIDFERRNWWEGAEAQVPLSTTATARTTNAVELYNPWNAAASRYQHFVHIDYADVAGDLPGATRLEITNTKNDAAGIRWIWIGQNFTRPDDFISVLEAENAFFVTPLVSVLSSGGLYTKTTINNNSEMDVLTWQLTANDLSFAAGRWYKALLRFELGGMSAVTGKFRIQLEYNGAAIWKSPLVAPDSNYDMYMRDLITFQFPPSLAGETNLSALDLVLTCYQNSGIAQEVWIDCMILLPVDGYRMLEAWEMEYNRRIVDDGITPIVYEDNGSGAGKIPIIGYSTPIMLQPNRTQRLYFVSSNNFGGLTKIDQTLSVKLYYRPRRLSI